ncbi:MAG TPA: nuclear transport factor 2 family protein [Acidimicrobiales bacterium]|jgi:hypothetical protein|nr:nuclear transport factor 2 family protein [Acidimicrobiales bacterium]
MTSEATDKTDIHERAVEHAALAARAAYLGWRHLRSEYSQDIDTVLATLETRGPWTWTLPVGAMAASETDGTAASVETLQYVCATTMEEIREQYVNMRTAVELWDWISMTDLRSSWYMVTHGVGSLIEKPLGNVFQVESVTMFPIGSDGILGEVQIGAIANERPNRWPEVPSGEGHVPFPVKRLEATILHNEFMAAIRSQDPARIAATMRPNVASAIRSYLVDGYEMANLEGVDALDDYYTSLFERFEVLELRLVNRVVESWFVFAELHWVVRHRAGAHAGDVVEFCTADIAPIDAAGRFWVRTGVGTNPQPTAPGRLAPYLDERGPADKQGWEFDLIAG